MPVVAQKYWTYEEYSKEEEGNYFEIINGDAIMSPAPKINHQRILKKLLFLLDKFISENNSGEVLPSPVDVIFTDDIILQPDIVFIAKTNEKIIHKEGIFGAPDMVVEIISDSSYKIDTEDKRKIFQQFGVKEYWIVLPSEKIVEILKLNDNRYEVFDFGAAQGTLRSSVLKDFEINIEKIFS